MENHRCGKTPLMVRSASWTGELWLNKKHPIALGDGFPENCFFVQEMSRQLHVLFDKDLYST